MTRQTFVDERVVGAQQIRHAAIFAQGAVDEEPGLLRKCREQIVVEVRIEIRMRDHFVDAAQVQPL